MFRCASIPLPTLLVDKPQERIDRLRALLQHTDRSHKLVRRNLVTEVRERPFSQRSSYLPKSIADNNDGLGRKPSSGLGTSMLHHKSTRPAPTSDAQHGTDVTMTDAPAIASTPASNTVVTQEQKDDADMLAMMQKPPLEGAEQKPLAAFVLPRIRLDRPEAQSATSAGREEGEVSSGGSGVERQFQRSQVDESNMEPEAHRLIQEWDDRMEVKRRYYDDSLQRNLKIQDEERRRRDADGYAYGSHFAR